MDYKKETSKTYKPDDPITKTTYEEIYRLMQPNPCQISNRTSINTPVRMNDQPPVPIRSVSLNVSHNNNNNNDIPNVKIPNKALNKPSSIENQKILSQNTPISINTENNQWKSSSNMSSSPIQTSPTIPVSSPQYLHSNEKTNDKKQKNNIDSDENVVKRKIISIEENSNLYSRILIKSYKNNAGLSIYHTTMITT
ncbi:hypothetical protein PIROE2DRAFT_3390 [Piromyces sp. E2]|nr:hypothetical protein PIROE2DRAFT_3390 [Piromyces sp. E2]|eukprot:OUM68859.1 hypothetical protein PIROE2DRAFT_3390 [Piromyces sp. E2]